MKKSIWLFVMLLFLVMASCQIEKRKGETPSIGEKIDEPECTPELSSSKSTIGDGWLISNTICSPPCFWGIEPGKTTQADALNILSQQGVLEQCKRFFFEDVVGWTCQSYYSPEKFTVSVWRSSGIVKLVRFRPTISITLGDVVKKYGDPSSVRLWNISSPETPVVQAYVYYADLQVMLSLAEQERWEYDIQPDIFVYEIMYLDRVSMEDDFVTFARYMEPWNGYGVYSVQYP